MLCTRCGGVIVETRETFPYIGPHGYLVELRDVRAVRCAMCGVGDWELPELRALDVLIRVLATEQPRGIPQLVFKGDRWRLASEPMDESAGDSMWPRA